MKSEESGPNTFPWANSSCCIFPFSRNYECYFLFSTTPCRCIFVGPQTFGGEYRIVHARRGDRQSLLSIGCSSYIGRDIIVRNGSRRKATRNTVGGNLCIVHPRKDLRVIARISRTTGGDIHLIRIKREVYHLLQINFFQLFSHRSGESIGFALHHGVNLSAFQIDGSLVRVISEASLHIAVVGNLVGFRQCIV